MEAQIFIMGSPKQVRMSCSMVLIDCADSVSISGNYEMSVKYCIDHPRGCADLLFDKINSNKRSLVHYINGFYRTD